MNPYPSTLVLSIARPGQQLLNGLVMLATLALGAFIVCVAFKVVDSPLMMPDLIWIFLALALAFGILMTLPFPT